MQLQDYLNQLRTLIHDTNSANFTDATLINFINQARTRVALDTHCIRGFLSVNGGSSLNTIPATENYSYNGTIGGINITNFGNNNYTNPTVTITNAVGDTTGAGATAVAVITPSSNGISGPISNIFMTNWGSNYTLTPTVTITDSTGTGAQASAQLLSNIFDIMSITVIWGNERIIFAYCGFTMFQTYFRSLVSVEDVPSVYTIHQGIQQVYMSLVPDQAYVMEWDVLYMPNSLVNNTDVDTQIIAPFSDAVQFYAAYLCAASLANFSAARFWYEPKNGNGVYDMRIKQLPPQLFSRRIFNPYRTFAKRYRRM